jgi:hypothetical protein
VDGDRILTMTIYFSLSTEGFYNSDAGVPVPPDAIEITKEQYETFLTSMNTENKKLVLENDKLILVERELVINWNITRTKRNKLLKDSDHKMMPDYPSDKEVWSAYRQELRDIPQKYADPNKVLWPEQPT